MRDDISPFETALGIIRKKEYPVDSRLNAILYIVEKFSQDSLPLLEELLHDPDQEEDIRSAAALALGKIGGERPFLLLKEMATQTKSSTLKNYAVQALGLLGSEESIPLLLDALKETDNTIFYSAAEALGRIGRPVLPHLIQLLDKEQAEDARCIAAWQLGVLKYSEAIPTLLEIISTDKNTDLIALSVWALGEIGIASEEVITVLNQARLNENPAIHERASMALKKIARHIN
jgi:HEAT repeat protein